MVTQRAPSCNDGDARLVEQRLVAAACRHDTQAARQLIDLHKQRLFTFVRRMIRNHHDAEEVVQDAFLKAFASLESFSPEYRFSTWLFTIAYRLCLNLLRKKRGPLSAEMDFVAERDASAGPLAVAAGADDSRRLQHAVWQAVDRLSAPQRAAVVLFYRHEQSCQEIAQVLELPVATVKSHLHRARAHLREFLEPVVAQEPAKLRILFGLTG